jgi:hypothetical protein
VHEAAGLQAGSALKMRVPLMEGSVVEILLRQGQLHIIVTQPELIQYPSRAPLSWPSPAGKTATCKWCRPSFPIKWVLQALPTV